MAANSWSSIQNINMWVWGVSGSEKTNPIFDQICQQPDIDTIYMCAKDPYKAKYQLLISKREGSKLKSFNDCKNFINYSNYIRYWKKKIIIKKVKKYLFMQNIDCTQNIWW